jgi:tetratricopeptide (TPR) repeat protein
MAHPWKRPVVLFVTFAVGLAAGAVAGRKNPVSPAMYQGKEPVAAATTLLEVARLQAGDGSWENLAVARVLYLGPDKAAGQEIIDRVLAAKKVSAGDVVRVARIYAEAGEWERAKGYYDRVVEMAPDDEDWLAEAGAQYLVHGDRTKAEELFARSFSQDPDALYNTLRVAAAYAGIAPRG